MPRYGLLAASVMTVVTEAVLVSQHLWTLREYVRLMQWGRILLRPLLAAVFMAFVVLLIWSSVSLFVAFGIGAAVYTLASFVLDLIGKDEWQFIRTILPSAKVSTIE